MTFQKRLKKTMKRLDMRTADLARWFDRPYTTVREWVLHGRNPADKKAERRLATLERQ
jgi:predicted transcriptional regulator